MGIPLTLRSTVAASTTRMVVYIQSLNAEYVIKSDIDCESKAIASQKLIDHSTAVLSTNGVYWCIIEAGLGLTAACLPTLYGLFRTKALESIVRSVRSIASLRSSPTGSKHSQQSRSGSVRRDAKQGSTTSHAEILVSNAHNIEMQPLPKPNDLRFQKTADSEEEPNASQV